MFAGSARVAILSNISSRDRTMPQYLFSAEAEAKRDKFALEKRTSYTRGASICYCWRHAPVRPSLFPFAVSNYLTVYARNSVYADLVGIDHDYFYFIDWKP